MTALAERLGYGQNARLVVIHAEDLGFCHSANVGVFESLRTGLASSASLIVPGPWAREAAARYRGEDVGVQLTVNAEHELYRWGPITQSPSLLGGDGGFPRTMEDVWDHADLDEVRRECRAQIERAILWGFDVSHLSTHLATLQLRPEFFDICLELAGDFALPLCLLGHGAASQLGFPARSLADEEGVVAPDDMVAAPVGGSAADLEQLIEDLAPGVTEIRFRPAVDSAELRSAANDWEQRVLDHRLLCQEPWQHVIRGTLERWGVPVIGFRAVRDVLRDAGVRQERDQLLKAAASTPSKRSTSSTSTGPTRLRASR